MRRYALLLAISFGVVVLTGASPIADLLSRVEMLEMENQSLSQQVTSLNSELDKHLVAIDADGNEVGAIYDAELNLHLVGVMLDINDHPRFALAVRSGSSLRSINPQSLFFTSDDCSGTPLMVNHENELLPRVFLLDEDGRYTVFLSSPVSEAPTFVGSSLNGGGDCNPEARLRGVAPATSVPEMQDLFTPPFRIVTRSELLAE